MPSEKGFSGLSKIPRLRVFHYPGIYRDLGRAALSGRLIEGPEIARFEERLARYVGVRHVIAVSSARVGLGLTLKALGLQAGDEVLLAAYNYQIIPRVLGLNGLRPVLVDIDPQTLTLDPGQAEQAIGERTRAMIATHLFGVPCELDLLVEIAQRHNLYLIEDCAHSCGATYRGRAVGSFGTAALFSFETSKGLNAFGGGAVATNDTALAGEIRRAVQALNGPALPEIVWKVVRSIAHELFTRRAVFSLLAYPALRLNLLLGRDIVHSLFRERSQGVGKKARRFANVQAIVGNRQLDRLDSLLEARRENIRVLEARLGQGDRLRSQAAPRDSRPAYLTFTLLAPHPAALAGELLRRGVDSMRHYMQNCARLERVAQSFPTTEGVERGHLHLPAYAGLRSEEMERVARVVLDFVQGPASERSGMDPRSGAPGAPGGAGQPCGKP